MAIAPLTDLLPSLFDSAVLRLTRRPLLVVERNAILTALVNGIGESVTRQVHHAATEAVGSVKAESPSNPEPEDITEIETFDRFSDEWMPRPEIVHSIEHSSGLDHNLSEFALFLMESRIDSMLCSGKSDVVGIGEISSGRSLSEVYPTRQETLKLLNRVLTRSNSAVSERSAIWRFLFGREDDNPFWRLVEQAQLIASMREPLSYKIVLAETLAFKSDKRLPKDINIEANTKNRVIEPREPLPPPGINPLPPVFEIADVQPVSQSRVPT